MLSHSDVKLQLLLLRNNGIDDLFIQTISIAPLQVHYYYSEALPTLHEHCAGASRRSATGNCPRSLRGCYRAGSRTHDLSDERRRLNQCATHACRDCSMINEVF